MNKRTALAGILGGVALFLYGALMWMVFPVYSSFFPRIPQYGRVQALLSELPLRERVIYQISDWKGSGLKGIVQIVSKTCDSSVNFIAALFLNIAVALIMARLFSLTIPSKKAGLGHAIRFYLGVGAVVHMLWQGVEVIWMSGDFALNAVMFADGLAGFLILGLIASALIKPSKK